MKQKPDCYKCIYRKGLMGSRSKCIHPDAKFDNSVPEVVHKMGIEAGKTGIEKGWFNWPDKFDPVWLISCNGFETKETKTESES